MNKCFRVKKNTDFQRIFRNGSSFANRQFVLYQLPREQKHFRVGISVSKKLGNAVTRNRIKRKIRAAVQELNPHIKEDKDFIIIARKPVVTLEYSELVNNLRHVFYKSGALKKL